MGEIQTGQDAARQRTRMIRRPVAIAACVLVVLAVLWFVAHRSERRVFSVTNLPADGKPAFVSTSKSTTDLGPLSNLPIQKRIAGFFLKLKMRIVPAKPNPAAHTFT